MSLARILIVDDDPAMQRILHAWLEMAGYETLAAWDGAGGLESLGQSPFDLALVDYRMPGMDGLEVLSQIEERHIPVGSLLLTASHNLDLVVEAMRRGALDCVFKPARLSEEPLKHLGRGSGLIGQTARPSPTAPLGHPSA